MSDIIIESLDGVVLKIDRDVAMQSQFLANIINNGNITEPIIINDVKGDILEIVIEYCEYRHENDLETFDYMTQWDRDFFEVIEKDRLLDVVRAANSMQIDNLLNVVCQYIGNEVYGKSVAEIEKYFKITDKLNKNKTPNIRYSER